MQKLNPRTKKAKMSEREEEEEGVDEEEEGEEAATEHITYDLETVVEEDGSLSSRLAVLQHADGVLKVFWRDETCPECTAAQLMAEYLFNLGSAKKVRRIVIAHNASR